jgi:hypothetical protein
MGTSDAPGSTTFRNAWKSTRGAQPKNDGHTPAACVVDAQGPQ